MKKKKENIEANNIVRVFTYTVLFFLFMYIMTAVITGEIKLSKEKEQKQKPVVNIQYDEILAGETFGRPEAEYFVIFYEFKDTGAQMINTAIDNYNIGEKSLKVYKVNLSNNFNKNIYNNSDKKIKANNASDLRVDNYTLIKIKNGKNILQVEGKKTIIDYLDK